MGMKTLVATLKHRNIAILALFAFGSLPMAACTQGNSSADEGSRSTISDVPPIYVAQTLVLLVNGQSPEEKEYREGLTACRNAGASVTPLNDEDVGKLGRTYYQLWFEGGRSAWQEDQWKYNMAGDGVMSCDFSPVHTSEKVITTAKASYEIDLIANTAVSEPPLRDTGGGSGGADDDDQLDPGAAQAGLQRMGYATDAGQRCLRWRTLSGIESCTWSEGSRWNFPRDEGSDQAVSYDPGVIVLWVHSADGIVPELTTQEMTVGGQPFDDALFQPPSGVTVKADEK